MHRRNFLLITAGLLIPHKELVVQYESTDPALRRTVIITNEIKPQNPCHQHDEITNHTMILDAKRAWILPDGRLEVERYMVRNTPCKITMPSGRIVTMNFSCCRDQHNNLLTETTILKHWTVRLLDGMGRTISERHSTQAL